MKSSGLNQSFLGLSSRITIGAIIIVVLGTMMLMLIEEARLRDIYKTELSANLERALNVEEWRLNQAIKDLREDVLFLSNTPPISGIVRAALNHGYDTRDSDTRARWEARLQQVFAAYSASHPDYYQIRYIGVADGGREIVRVDNRGGKVEITPSARLQAKADRDYFKATLGLRAGEVYLSEFNLNREWGVIEQPYRPTLRVATPIFAPGGEIFGMVVINMDVSRLLGAAVSGLPAGVQAYISNANGAYLLHPDAERSFGFELGGKDNATADFPSLKTVFDRRAPEHHPLHTVATKTDAQYLVAKRIHFDASDPVRFLVMIYRIPDSVLAQQMIMIPPAHILGGLIAMLLVGGIVLLVLRRTFAPLEQITAAADQIAAGNHDVKLPQAGGGEIGRLASALSIMLDKLLQREQEILRNNAALEVRISDRTHDLSAINELLQAEVLRGKKLQQETEALLRRIQALMQTSMDGIHVIDMQGNIVIANDAFCRMLGYTREEAGMLNVVDWAVQFSAESLQERFRDLIGKSVLIETQHRRKDGMLINVEVSASGVEIEGQCFVYFSSRDITWRKQAETALLESEGKFRSIFEQAGVGVAIIGSKTGQFQQVNKKYADIVGLDVDEMLATSFMEITHPDDLQVDLDNMEKLRDGLIAEFTIEKRYLHKNGSIVWVALTVSPLRREGGELNQHIAIVTDITERKRIENELRIAAAAFETHDAIMITDADGNIIRVNQAFSAITGYTPKEVLGKNPSMMNSGRHDQPFYASMWQQLLDTGVWAGEIWDRHKSGQIYPKWLTITAVKNELQTTICYVAIFSDITARKQIEEAKLRESEERFRGTLEQAAVGIAHATLDGYFKQVNQKFCQIVGYTRDELMHMRFHDLTFFADLDDNVRYIQQLLAGEIPTFSMEKRYVRKDHGLVWVNLTVSLLRDDDGAPKYTIGVIEDITRRKELEEDLHRSETKFRTVYESSSDAIMLLDESGFLDCNETTLRIFGCSTRDDFIHKHPYQYSPLTQPGGENSKSLAEEHIATAFKNGSNKFEWMHCRLDGTEFLAEVYLTSMVLNGVKILQATVRDITERKRAEQQLRNLSTHLLTVREEEKTRVAREIHDDLGGTLTGLKMDAYWLKRGLHAGKEMALLLERIESMSGQLDNAVETTRRIITDLRPTMLDDLGLVAALEWQATQFRKRTGIECQVVCSCGQGYEAELDKTQSINLFRIFQEALTNVARHSGASRVEVEFEQSDEGVSLSISDNGCGLPEGHTIASSSYGIRGMCERVGQLGGKIKFDKSTGGGFSLTVILPPQADNEEIS